MKVPFIDLQGQIFDCGEALIKDVADVVRSCRYILGEHGRKLEETIATECGSKHAVGVSSGTDALILALTALGLKPGQKVVVPAFTFAASVSAIIFAGGEPYFVDVDEHTFNMDIDQAIAASGDVAGYIPVHLYGLPAKMEMLLKFAHERERFVLEDCAQAFGATLEGKPVGSIGDAGIFSFYPTKNLSAAGDAGMILTNDEDVAKRCQLLRNHGEEVRYHHTILGRNCRLDEIQASVLLNKLPFVKYWNERRREIAQQYNEGLKGFSALKLPIEPPGCHHVYNLYTVRTMDRDSLRKFLDERGIGTGVYYPVAMPDQPIFSRYVAGQRNFPVTNSLCNEVLSLPMFPHMSNPQVEYVIHAIREFFGS